VLNALKPGAAIPFKGPFKKLPYTANMKAEVGMIAGGTGITPMLQVLVEGLSNAQDKTKFTLVFANNTPKDILLKERLDALAVQHPTRFRVHYVVTKPEGKDWKGCPSPLRFLRTAQCCRCVCRRRGSCG
jgi:cytochrome-b5 reductase